MTRTRPDELQLIEGELTGQIIGAFYECYNDLRFGYLESVYRRALAVELRLRGVQFQAEAPVEVCYKGVSVGHFRVDLLVERRWSKRPKLQPSLALWTSDNFSTTCGPPTFESGFFFALVPKQNSTES